MSDTFSLIRGNSPLLVSVPHAGTALPDSLRERLVPRAVGVEDTDWHLERLARLVERIDPIVAAVIGFNLASRNASELDHADVLHIWE